MITIVSATEEEWIDSLKQHWQVLQESEKNRTLQEIKDHIYTYDLNTNWEKWMEWNKNHPESNFLFFTQPTDSKHLLNAYVMNIKETVWTLQKNYSLFSRILKTEFDPLKAALDFTNPQSDFWKEILSNSLLEGILFGYGERNSYFFDLEFKKKEEIHEQCLFYSHSSSEVNEEEFLPMPLFRSYQTACGEDPIITKYKKEREQIRNQLKGKNFTQEVLTRLYSCQ